MDRWIARSGFKHVLELPSPAVRLDNCDGRLIVTLPGGRIIDLTDWLAETHDAPN